MCAVRTSAPHVVLTYDDGPEPGSTEAVLEALRAFRATATFFVLMTRVRRFPGLLAEVVAEGHEVGLHGLDHRRLTGFPADEVERRTRSGRAELEDVIGRAVTWFRPPYGTQSPRTWRAVTRDGLVPVLWGPTLRDWQDVSQDERVAGALRGSRGGAIVLGHDGFAGPEDGVDDGPAPLVDRGDLTRRLLRACGERGLVGRSLGDALVVGEQSRRAWFRR
ncbi:polysaccharide deacetylase family protein [Saccharothrix syringae]|uniref:polysaccharide deacetylase family protein n=1 Tax=Saccharothrix syringae TaxID=103733 RepID=UPI001B80DAEB|nr:polysaccharide deacetylase family protein [Saccharothrix syringae]